MYKAGLLTLMKKVVFLVGAALLFCGCGADLTSLFLLKDFAAQAAEKLNLESVLPARKCAPVLLGGAAQTVLVKALTDADRAARAKMNLATRTCDADTAAKAAKIFDKLNYEIMCAAAIAAEDVDAFRAKVKALNDEANAKFAVEVMDVCKQQNAAQSTYGKTVQNARNVVNALETASAKRAEIPEI